MDADQRGARDAAVEQSAVGRDGVVDRGRMRALGCQPVVDAHQPGSGATGEV
jgi:hypothetical protein